MPHTVDAPNFVYHGAESGIIIIVCGFFQCIFYFFKLLYVTQTINQYITDSSSSSQFTSYKLDTRRHYIIGPQNSP